jgi:myosin-1
MPSTLCDLVLDFTISPFTTTTPMSASSIHADAPPAVVQDPEGLQYETGAQLGKGGFAICHRAKLLGHEHLGSSTVALKIVKSKMEPPKLAQKVQEACKGEMDVC